MMFDIDNFSDYEDFQSYVEKLNKYLRKDKERKIFKIFDDFKEFIEEEKYITPITFILSILAEEKIELIRKDIISEIKSFLHSEDLKLRTNSIIIIGFYLLNHPSIISEYFDDFLGLLLEDSQDLKENGYFFLQQFLELKPELFKKDKNLLLEALEKEEEKKDLISLLAFLEKAQILNFKQTYKLREILLDLLKKFRKEESPKLFNLIYSIIPKFFDSVESSEIQGKDANELVSLLNEQFIMKKYNFNKISENKKIRFKTFLKKFKKTRLKDVETYFYAKDREKNIIFFFELEKEKLSEFFQNSTEKISRADILDRFSPVLDGEKDLELFMNTLMKLKIVNGYLSEFYYYPYDYIKNQIFEKLENKGIVKLKTYKFLPPNFIKKIIANTSSKKSIPVLVGKSKKSFYSLKLIQKQINSEAAKHNVIDLSEFQKRLTKKSFIRLIRKIPEGYLTDIHKGTIWLTNIGLIKIKREIENSKIIGYIDLKKISEKLEIQIDILKEVLKEFIDFRSGLWDNDEKIFYYSKFIKKRIDNIAKIPDETQKNKRIGQLANELNISRKRIITKLDENYQLIGDEIKEKDQIKISDYLEKLGMKMGPFMKFIKDMDLDFLKKGDLLIFNESKIKTAQKELKRELTKNSQKVEYFDLEEFEINPSLVRDLLQELIEEGEINGILYETEDSSLFYTIKGIRNMMLGTEITLYFEDLFYGKELSEREIKLLKSILRDLMKSGKLKGNFDEEQLAFSRDVLKFADDFFSTLQSFRSIIEGYYEKFDKEFETIKSVLTKKEDPIYPQEIKIVEESVKRIKKHYLAWQNNIDAFIHLHNKRILKEQGYSMSRYNGLAENKREEIMSFKEDDTVKELVEGFETWVRLFNEIEQKFGKVIFNQKKVYQNPDNKEAKEKLEELLLNLNMQS